MIPDKALYLRSAELIIGSKTGKFLSTITPANAISIKTRLNFSVEKSEDSHPNTASIKIYNLSPKTRAFIEGEDRVVFLNAGYKNIISTIFFGDIITEKTRSMREGADIATQIECGDGEKTLLNSLITFGYKSVITNKQIIDFALLRLGASLSYVEPIPIVTFKNGYSYTGLIKDLLDTLFKQVNLKWSIQDGSVKVMSANKADLQEAVLISPKNGLISIPTKSEKVIKFDSLLNPQLSLGRAVQLRSSFITSAFGAGVIKASQTNETSSINLRVSKVQHKGDTLNGAWMSKVQGISTEFI